MTAKKQSHFETIIFIMTLLVAASSYAQGESTDVFNELVDNYSQIKEKKLDKSRKRLSSSDVEKFQGKNSQDAANAAADQYLKKSLNEEQIRSSEVGRSLMVINDGYKSGVTLGDGQRTHKFDFSFHAFQSMAQVDYKGLIQASLILQATDSSSDLRVTEKIFGETELVLNYLSKPKDQMTGLNLKWNW